MLSKPEDSYWGFVVYAPKTFRKGRRFPERITALQRLDQNALLAALLAAFRFIPIGFTEVDPRISAKVEVLEPCIGTGSADLIHEIGPGRIVPNHFLRLLIKRRTLGFIRRADGFIEQRVKLRSEVKRVHGHQCVSSVRRLRAISERKQTANGRISSLKSNFGL